LWEFRFSQWRVWRWQPYGKLCRVFSWKFTDVSDVLTTSIIRAISLFLFIWIFCYEWFGFLLSDIKLRLIPELSLWFSCSIDNFVILFLLSLSWRQ
jgi:hypothetical protein